MPEKNAINHAKTPTPINKEKPKCRIHEEVAFGQVDSIRQNVCVSETDYPLTEFKGNHYCLFHLPDKKKDIEKFENIFKSRLIAVEANIDAIKRLFEDEHNIAKRGIDYDFRYVWFPSIIWLNRYKFKTRADFESATFTESANFSWSTFTESANFSLAIFMKSANFRLATFKKSANFRLAIIMGHGDFRLAKFTGYANFNLTKFTKSINFRLATFTESADFASAVFTESADFASAVFTESADFTNSRFGKNHETLFKKTKFLKDTFFDKARFENDVIFNSAIFGSDSDIFFRKTFFAWNADFQYCILEGYLRFSDLQQAKENTFDFQEAAFEKANRISFHTVRLQPNWFVNVDARKFVFTDIKWKNIEIEGNNENILRELEYLEKRGIEESGKRLLEVACRQLAVNAEENNRYEDGSKFRYMAMETRRLENKGWQRFLNLHFFYKWSSGYGESWRQAFFVLLGILALFSLLYAMPFANFDYAEKKEQSAENFVMKTCEKMRIIGNPDGMTLCDGVAHSLFVAALQRPEPKPADALTKFFVILETIFAPLQAALLALAIRRKFMR